MSDDRYKADDVNDEYQFSETEAVVYKDKEQKKSWSGILANRRLWLLIGIIIVAVVFYKLSNVFTATKEKLPEEITTPAELKPSVATQPVTAPTSEKAVLPEQGNFSVDSSLQRDKRLNEVEQQNQQDEVRLNKLETKLSDMDTNFNHLRAQLSQIQLELQNFTGQLADLQQQLKKIEPKPKTKPVPTKEVKKPAVVQPPVYHVQAVIPGRAWLLNPKDATTMSVAVGDLLPGYGTVIRINPVQASVITSSGYTIVYKPD